MMGGQYTKQVIEALYLNNDKDYERTFDKLLSGNVPKDQMKVVVIDKDDKEKMEMIDTSSKRGTNN